MSTRRPGPTRRDVVSRLVVASLPTLAPWATASDDFGPVLPPSSPPSTRLLASDGHPVELARLLQGRVTAVQLMFTGCSSTCPLQGAVFAAAQARLARESADLRLLSISIDPLGDAPETLRAWLARFDANPVRWTAAVPTIADRDRLVDHLRGRASGLDTHATRIYVFDRQARLVYRTTEWPTAERIASLLRRSA